MQFSRFSDFSVLPQKATVITALLLLFFSGGCAVTSNPDDNGGEIIATPDASWCSFSISSDGRWLQYEGDVSPLTDRDSRNASNQRETYLVDLETGENFFAEPDPTVKQRIEQGIGPDGLGCFSPGNQTLYLTIVDWNNKAESERSSNRIEDGSSPQVGMSTPSRSRARFHYKVDLTGKPLVIQVSDDRNCAERPEPVKPNIRVEQPSDKRIEIYAGDGRQLAAHRPGGLTSSRIGIWDLDSNQWRSEYSLSPDGSRLAYRISETGMIGFSAPTRGYMLNLNPNENPGPDFLGASVYDMAWDPAGNFYACTSHSKHHRSIARWTF